MRSKSRQMLLVKAVDIGEIDERSQLVHLFLGHHALWSGSRQPTDGFNDEKTLELDDWVFAVQQNIVTLGFLLAIARVASRTGHIGRLNNVVRQKLTEIGH